MLNSNSAPERDDARTPRHTSPFPNHSYRVECSFDNDEYVYSTTLALIGILLYPVGISLVYALLLLKERDAMLNEKPTALSTALRFLTQGESSP